MLVIFHAVAAGSSGASGGRSWRTTTIASVIPEGRSNTSVSAEETTRYAASAPAPAGCGGGTDERTTSETDDPSRATTPYVGMSASGETAPSTMYVDRV